MKISKTFPKLLAALGLVAALAGCGVNSIPTKDQTVKARWGDVQAAYQRRSDLIPNLVATVQGYAAQEKSVLTAGDRGARPGHPCFGGRLDHHRSGGLPKFQAGAESTCPACWAICCRSRENYPDLKSNQNFLALQAQLEGTENRIEIARRDYNARGAGLQHRAAHLSRRDLGGDHVQSQKPATGIRRQHGGAERAGGELHRPAAPRQPPTQPARRRPSIRTMRFIRGPDRVPVLWRCPHWRRRISRLDRAGGGRRACPVRRRPRPISTRSWRRWKPRPRASWWW